MSDSMIILWINTETNSLLPSWNSFGSYSIPQIKQGDSVGFEIHWVRSDLSGQFLEEVYLHPNSVIKVAVGVPDGTPTDGYFTYSFDGDTVDIPYGSSASEVNTLINSLSSITSAGGVSVSIVNKRTYRIVFNEFGSRSMSTCDSTALRPSTNVVVSRINAGTSSSKEVQHLRPKLLPVAYSDGFVNTQPPEITITQIDSITSRIEISPSPKFGTFAISNGTLTTGAISVDASAGSIMNELSSSGLSNSTRAYSVSKSGNYSWDIYRTNGTAETLTVTDSGIIGFSSKVGTVDFNTVEVEDMLAGSSSVSATLEVEYSYGDAKHTIYQGTVTLVNDLIENATYNPIPFPDFGAGGGGISDAPSDGTKYARKDGAWVSFTEEDNQGITQSAGDARYAQLTGAAFSGDVTITGRVGIGGGLAINTANKLAVYNGNIVFSNGFGLAFGDGTTQITGYIPSSVAITGGTIDGITIDGGTY